MSVSVEREDGGRPRLAAALGIGTALALVATGLLLWASQGDAVFVDVVLNAFAWCF